MFKVYPVSLQTFIDTPNCVLEDRVQYSTVRVQYSTVRVPNVFCNGRLQIINSVGIVRIHSSKDNTIITKHVFLASLLGLI
jgi:hypothetical protein